jgi:diguanylate cyclase (GGDEF)-like protein/PAS domain S-box-containing protein
VPEEESSTQGHGPDAHLKLLQAVLQALADAAAPEQALDRVIDAVCATLHWDYGARWRQDEQTHDVTCTQMWHAPFLENSEFVAMTRGTSFVPGPGGLVRTALKTRQPFLVEDTSAAPGLRRAQAAVAAGLRSAFAFPLLAGGQTLGALEFFSRQPQLKDERLLVTGATIGAVVGEFVARKQSEEHYRDLVELSPDAIMVHCEDRYVFANSAAVHVLAAGDVSRLLGRDAYSILHPDYEYISRARVRQTYEERTEVPRAELKYIRLDGGVIDVEASSRYFMYAGKPAIQTIFRDITERKRAERKIARLNKLYAALSQTHTAIAQVADPRELFREACRIAVDYGGFQFAGVMEISADGRAGTIVASHGIHQEMLAATPLDLDRHAHHASGPIAAVRKSAHCICNDFVNDPRSVAWRDLLRGADFRSGGMFPVRRSGKVVAALVVYCAEAEAFDAEMIALLDEIAANLSVALDAIEHDVQRRIAESALQEQERTMATLLRNLPGMAYRRRLDEQWTLEFVSDGALDLTGHAPDALVKNRRISFIQLVHPDDRDRMVHEIREKLVHDDRFVIEYQIVCANGVVKWVSEKAQAVRDASGAIIALEGIVDDITDRKHFEERLAVLAQYDVLTGLPNRSLFYDRLRRAIVRARREQTMVGLMFLDLDRFKQINDSLGHAAGDRVLRTIADRLKSFLREIDTIARLGGDEFTVIIEGVSEPLQVSSVAEKIGTALLDPIVLDGRDMLVSASVGITLYPRDAEDIEHLVKNADIAMYHAKNRGGRQQFQFYDKGMVPFAAELLEMEAKLKRALENDEFVMEYQPTVDVRDDRMIGMEALVRWKSPDGLVPPSKFIPVAEESGLILDIGRWVLKTACAQLRAWQKEGLPPLRLAANLSPLQFKQGNLVEMVSEVLRETGLGADQLELEINEHTIMERSRDAMATLRRLHELGVHLCVDDFGTGYSSLAYLKQFPVHRLKIDKSFIADITGNSDAAAVVRAMTAMARNLGLDVVAEGVETRAQLDFLRAAGCDAYQGYYFSVPLPAQAFAELVRRQAQQRQ